MRGTDHHEQAYFKEKRKENESNLINNICINLFSLIKKTLVAIGYLKLIIGSRYRSSTIFLLPNNMQDGFPKKKREERTNTTTSQQLREGRRYMAIFPSTSHAYVLLLLPLLPWTASGLTNKHWPVVVSMSHPAPPSGSDRVAVHADEIGQLPCLNLLVVFLA
jgi:hypothetical protein